MSIFKKLTHINAQFLGVSAVILLSTVFLCVEVLFDADSKWMQVVLLALNTIALIWLVLLIRPILNNLKQIRDSIQKTSVDGDLERDLNITGKNELSSTGSAYNALLGSFKIIISKFQFESRQMNLYSKDLENTANVIAESSTKQYSASHDVAAAIEQFTASMAEVESNSKQTEQIASFAHEVSEKGITVISNAKSSMLEIKNAVDFSNDSISELHKSSDEIEFIAKSINEIASQTNLLALNAAIEAARAGEAGRGFAVVADEVRKLAERTSSATSEITSLTKKIQSNIIAAKDSISNCTSRVSSGTTNIESAVEILEVIKNGADETSANVDAVATAISEQTNAIQSIAHNIQNILTLSEQNNAVAVESRDKAHHLSTIAAGIKEIESIFKMVKYAPAAIEKHQQMPEFAKKAAERLSAVLEQALRNNTLTEDALWSKERTPIPNTKPQKYHTKYDVVFDKIISPVQEQILGSDPQLAYSILTEPDGYVPTHNLKFSQPLTGDEKHDLVHNRTKRVFSDPVGVRCGSHTLPYILQTYRRDTGEILHDISVPVYVNGKHWGGVRIGYKI